jgi:hypothetical protein
MSPDSLPGVARYDRLLDRVNPVLVKEVRASLRGRAFAIGFTLVLILAMIASSFAMLVSTIDTDATPSGRAYLAAVGFVFALGAHGLVPFSAMASMSGEHDEASLELLQLSGISAARLVLGKLGAALVQAALIYAAFLPFLVFAFLLQGVDLTMIAAGIAASLVGSIAFSAFGILLGAVCRYRWLRVFGYVFLAMMLLAGVQALFAWIGFSFFAGGGSTWFSFWIGTSVTALVGALCLVLATARLQHAEENRSTPFRVLGTAALVIACAFGVASGNAYDAFVWFMVAQGCALPSLYLGVTEAERLPRAVLARARVRGIPWYRAPWMPGGGRAVLLLAAEFAFVLAAAALAMVLDGGSPTAWMRLLAEIWVVQIWLLVVLLLVSGFSARWLDRPWVQALARIATMALPIVLLLVPAFVRFLAGSGGDAFQHAGNPAYFERQIRISGEIRNVPAFAALAAAALLACVLNVPRVLRAFSELRADRARRAEPSCATSVSASDAQAQP